MNLPNKITTFRMAMVGVIAFILLFPFSLIGFNFPVITFAKLNIGAMQLIAFFLFLIASFSDFLDGYIARKYNLVTNYGKFMDPIADKLLVNSVLIIFTVPTFTMLTKVTAVPVIVTVIMIARDIIVDALRLVAMEKKQVISASKFGKAKTVCQMIALSLVLLNNWPFSLFGWNFNVTIFLCYVAGAVSLASGIDYLLKGRAVFKENKKYASEIIASLLEKNLTIGTIESLTAGLLGSRLSEITKASNAYKGGIATYTISAKENLANVRKETIAKYGVISLETVCEMAENGRKILDVDYCVALTGVAGPDLVDELPVGTVFLAIASKEEIKTYKLNITKKERNAIREEVVEETLRILYEDFFKKEDKPKLDKVKIINKIDNKIFRENTIVRYVFLALILVLMLFPEKYYVRKIMQMTAFGLDIPMYKFALGIMILIVTISTGIDYFLIASKKVHARQQVAYVLRILVYGGFLFNISFSSGFSYETGVPIIAAIVLLCTEIERYVILKKHNLTWTIYLYLAAAVVLVFVTYDNWPFNFIKGVNLTNILAYLVAMGAVILLILDAYKKQGKSDVDDKLKTLMAKINNANNDKDDEKTLGK